MAGKGGARPGAGRPRNAVKYAEEIKELNDAIAADIMDIYQAARDLAVGVKAPKTHDDDPDVWLVEPDGRMLRYLIDRLAGRAVQAVELTGEDGGPVAVELANLSTGDLDELERIARQLAGNRPQGGASRN